MAEKNYILKATNIECRFDTDEFDLSDGKHTFVVKAKAAGYKDSEYSNEVSVTVGAAAKGFTVKVQPDEDAGDFWDKGDRFNLYVDGVNKGTIVSLEGQSFTATKSVKFVSTGVSGGIVDYTMGGSRFCTDYFGDNAGEAHSVELTGDLTIVEVTS